MPTYQYKCPSCEFTAEIVHKISDNIPIICSNCMKSDMIKVPCIGVGLHFKGSGFYETDYKGK